jgi:hypothetical protein
MQWSDVVAPPPPKVLRQFAGTFFVLVLGLAGWRAFHGHAGPATAALAAAAIVVGVTGLLRPRAVRPVYTALMIAAFPIGWAVSMGALILVFFVVVTPVALLFRAIGRDELQLHRGDPRSSYWKPTAHPDSVREYLRQS